MEQTSRRNEGAMADLQWILQWIAMDSGTSSAFFDECELFFLFTAIIRIISVTPCSCCAGHPRVAPPAARPGSGPGSGFGSGAHPGPGSGSAVCPHCGPSPDFGSGRGPRAPGLPGSGCSGGRPTVRVPVRPHTFFMDGVHRAARLRRVVVWRSRSRVFSRHRATLTGLAGTSPLSVGSAPMASAAARSAGSGCAGARAAVRATRWRAPAGATEQHHARLLFRTHAGAHEQGRVPGERSSPKTTCAAEPPEESNQSRKLLSA